MHRRYPIVHLAIVCLLLYCPFWGNTQTSFNKKIDAAPVKTYTVGDKVPDLVFKNLVNYRSDKVKLSELKGKLVLIDFWELGCSNCIAAFPKFRQVREQFADKVEVITVTSLASREAYENESKQLPSMKGFSLPLVLEDDVLHKYFPFEAISHVVWIDGNGIVKAITGTEYVTTENVALALKDEHLPWPVKKDIIGFDYAKPLLGIVSEEAPAPAVLYYSAFTSYMEGLSQHSRKYYDSLNGTVIYNTFNLTLLQYCDGALKGQALGYINPKYLVLEVKDSSRYLWDSKKQYHNQWSKKNKYCYSITFPMQWNEEQQKVFIKKDLMHWLNAIGVAVKKEVREVPCYSLVLTRNNRAEVESHSGETQSISRYPYDSSLIRNEKISEFIYSLNNAYTDLPFLLKDETGYPDEFRLNMTFSKDAFAGFDQFKKELNRYGFDLKPSTTKEEVIVISDTDSLATRP